MCLWLSGALRSPAFTTSVRAVLIVPTGVTRQWGQQTGQPMADGWLKDSWKRKSVVQSYSQQCKRQDGRLGPTGSLGGGSESESGLPSQQVLHTNQVP